MRKCVKTLEWYCIQAENAQESPKNRDSFSVSATVVPALQTTSWPLAMLTNKLQFTPSENN